MEYAVCRPYRDLRAWIICDSQRTVNGKTDRLVGIEGGLADAKDNLASFKLAALQGENIKLQGGLNTQSSKVSGLEKDASDAKAAQQKVKIALSKQKEQTAIAERSLLELEEHVKPRHLSDTERDVSGGHVENIPEGPGHGFAFDV